MLKAKVEYIHFYFRLGSLGEASDLYYTNTQHQTAQ